MLILSWTVLVGGLVIPAMGVVHLILLYLFLTIHIDIYLTYLVLYLFLALLFMFYPMIGFVADVYCGRFRTVSVSLCAVLCFSLAFCVNLAFLMYGSLPDRWAYFVIAVALLCVFGVILGAAGYGANFVQFGLDQLLDAPSHHQTLFVHWAVWCYELLTVVFVALFAKYICYTNCNYDVYFISFLVVSFVLFLLLSFGWWKRHWFY